jgi:hypothetical protein
MRRVFHQEILPLDGAIARHETKHGKNKNMTKHAKLIKNKNNKKNMRNKT